MTVKIRVCASEGVIVFQEGVYGGMGTGQIQCLDLRLMA